MDPVDARKVEPAIEVLYKRECKWIWLGENFSTATVATVRSWAVVDFGLLPKTKKFRLCRMQDGRPKEALRGSSCLRSYTWTGEPLFLDSRSLRKGTWRSQRPFPPIAPEHWSRLGRSGLTRVGNESYMNAVFQCLLHTRPFVRFFFNETGWEELLNRGRDQVALTFAGLVGGSWSSYIEARALIPRKMALQQAICELAPQFAHGPSPDPHALLTVLLEGIEQGVARDAPPLPAVDVSVEAQLADRVWEMYLTKHYSVVAASCDGLLRLACLCSHCQEGRIVFTPFRTLSLPTGTCITKEVTVTRPVAPPPPASAAPQPASRPLDDQPFPDLPRPVEPVVEVETQGVRVGRVPAGENPFKPTLEDCLSAFQAPEPSPCLTCGHAVHATVSLWNAPNVLILRLNRFDGLATRPNSEVDFPIVLDMHPYVSGPTDRQLLYRLYAVLEHGSGRDPQGYSALVHVWPEGAESGHWVFFNNDIVTDAGPSPAHSDNAYILFYERMAPVHGVFSRLERRRRRTEFLPRVREEECGLNVALSDIVTFTSKSPCDDLGELSPRDRPARADLMSGSIFRMKDAPGEWVCWDFGEKRVYPYRYAIQSYKLRSWVLEGSLDGENWVTIDQQNRNQDDEGPWNGASFAVANPVNCRFIRLTQPETNDYPVGLYCIEFFGTLSH
jgi:ubiquitin C-terminal hydrolase